jgi:hypothetical protein
MIDDLERYQLNQRFVWDIIYKPHWFHIREREERIIDTKNGEKLILAWSHLNKVSNSKPCRQR